MRMALTVSLCLVLVLQTPRGGAPAPGRSLSDGQSFGNTTTALAGAVRTHIGSPSFSPFFERNDGQVSDDHVRFFLRRPGYRLFLTPEEGVFALSGGGRSRAVAGQTRQKESDDPPSVLRIKLADTNSRAQITGLEEQPQRINYFIGNDPRKWRPNVPTFARVRYSDVYPNIDMVYRIASDRPEYDFIVGPGGDPGNIRFRFDGFGVPRLSAEGDLILPNPTREIRQPKPLVYQDLAGGRRQVAARYRLTSGGEIGFQIAKYDTSAPLVIDPVIVFSTYLGGNSLDEGNDIAADAAGNCYVAGITTSSNFPAPTPPPLNEYQAFVAKFNPAGNLVFATVIGGSFTESQVKVRLDGANNVYLAGQTDSIDYPTTPGPFSIDPDGGADPNLNNSDLFITKFNPSGSAIIYSGYLGGNKADYIGRHGLAVDAAGSVYLTGYTQSDVFPTTPNAFQPVKPDTFRDAFVTKFNVAFTQIVYSTYLGGTNEDDGNGIAVDSLGRIWVCGVTYSTNFPTTANAFQPAFGGGIADAFVAKFDPFAATGAASLLYSTYLGGDHPFDPSDADIALDVAVDQADNAYVTGWTSASNFPTTPGAYDRTCGTDGNCNLKPGNLAIRDAFAAKFTPTGGLSYSTFLGGADSEIGWSIAVDSFGNAWVGGETQPFGSANVDVVLYKLNAAGSVLLYTTTFGGSQQDTAYGVAVSGSDVFITGSTRGRGFPILNAFQSVYGGDFSDAFAMRLSEPTPTPTPTPPPPSSFFVVTPCRIADTRGTPGPYGGPSLSSGATRVFTIAGQCGIPPGARAASLNVTVTAPTALGHLSLYPAGTALPLVSTINYRFGQTRANNAIVTLGATGGLEVSCGQATGTVHLVMDTNGYFQ